MLVKRLRSVLLSALLLVPLQPWAADWTEGRPNYFEITPPITVNIRASGDIRFVQLKIQLMSREVATLTAIEANKSALVDRLILLISEQSVEAMSDVRSRELIRKAALDQVIAVLRDVAGIVPKKATDEGGSAVKGIEALYFTDLVIQ